jgi:opacity protein-like surface antigen
MKKLILIALLALPAISWAQRFNGGALIGICASQVDGDTYGGFDKVGLQGGVFVNTKFSDAWGAQMEIKYNGKGARKKTSKDDFETYSLTLHYVDVPLIVNFTIKEKFILDAGLVPGYLFAKNGEENGYKFADEEILAFKKMDLSWLLGFNYKITDNFIANIRYSYSLFSIRDYENIDANYGIIAQIFGYTNGDYNNFLTMGIYYQFD